MWSSKYCEDFLWESKIWKAEDMRHTTAGRRVTLQDFSRMNQAGDHQVQEQEILPKKMVFPNFIITNFRLMDNFLHLKIKLHFKKCWHLVLELFMQRFLWNLSGVTSHICRCEEPSRFRISCSSETLAMIWNSKLLLNFSTNSVITAVPEIGLLPVIAQHVFSIKEVNT